MALNTVSLSDTVKVMYEKRLLSRAVARMVHGRWPEVATINKYGSYELRKFSAMTAVTSPLTQGTTPAEAAAPTISTVTMAPEWYGTWIAYTDQLDMQNYDPVVSEVSGILGEQAGISFDTLIRNTITDGATKDYSGTVSARGSVTDKIDYADFIGVVATLEVNNALPMEGEMFVVIMHPYSFAELMQDTTFVTLFTREGGDAIRTGKMGTILRCAIYVSSNARYYDNEGSGSVDVFSMLFIGKESYGVCGMSGLIPNYTAGDSGGEYSNNTGKSVSPVSIIMKGLGETGLDPLNQRGTIGWKATHDDVILNSAWIVDLEHATSYSL
jgi:N4-gp56 family major capsid protein